MNLTIGSTTIEVISCEQLRDNNKGFFLDIVAPVSSISMDEFYALLKDNKENIVITKDNGVVNTYVGFGLIGKFSCEDGVITVAQYANSEIEAQLSVTQNEIAEHKKTIERLQNEVTVQTVALENHATAITEQSAVIAMQRENIATQREEIDFLSDLLLEEIMA
jgi:hypothetical protein